MKGQWIDLDLPGQSSHVPQPHEGQSVVLLAVHLKDLKPYLVGYDRGVKDKVVGCLPAIRHLHYKALVPGKQNLNQFILCFLCG